MSVRDSGFDMLVLCAMEYQLPAEGFPGVEVIYAPNDDDSEKPLTRDQLAIALRAARQAAGAIRQGKQVLVTCRMGWNRSGLVSALVLHFLTGVAGWKCIQAVKKARKNALGNPSFLAALAKLPQSATTHQASSYAKTPLAISRI
jgi:protein-tyrosine phosphatase